MNDYLCTGGQHRPNGDSCACQNGESQTCCSTEQQEDTCPCRYGFVQSLQMLLRTGLSSLVDFQSFAFVTPEFLVGATLVAPTATTGPYDNLSADFTGTFNRFTQCACNDIDASGPVNLPVVGDGTTGLTVSRLSLCDLLAVAFTVTGDTAETLTANYQAARTLFQTLLQRRPPIGPDYPPYPDPCCTPCCPGAPDFGMGGTVSLIVGNVVLANVTVLGQIGGVLVLANDAAQRFYFVCGQDAISVG